MTPEKTNKKPSVKSKQRPLVEETPQTNPISIVEEIQSRSSSVEYKWIEIVKEIQLTPSKKRALKMESKTEDQRLKASPASGKGSRKRPKLHENPTPQQLWSKPKVERLQIIKEILGEQSVDLSEKDLEIITCIVDDKIDQITPRKDNDEILIEDPSSTAEKSPNLQVLPNLKFKEQKPFNILSMGKIEEEDSDKEDEKILYRDPILLEGQVLWRIVSQKNKSLARFVLEKLI